MQIYLKQNFKTPQPPMIEPMELQLNNLVLYEGQEVAIRELWNTDAILGDKAWSYVAPYKDLEPIPLTPELLERCGWLRYNENTFWLGISTGNMQRIVVTFTEDFIIISFSDEYSGTQKAYPLMGLMDIKFHTLQNLIKTLTGKELKIK